MNIAFFPRWALAGLALLLCTALLGGCSYTWKGQQSAHSSNSVLGDGTKTVRIRDVEHSTLYAWMPYSVRSLLRDEINARRLASWQDSGQADYELSVRIPTFTVQAYGQSRETNQLFTVTMSLELQVFDGHTNEQVWRSGLISYAERYQSVNEERAIDEAIRNIMLRAVDSMQNTF